MSSPGLPLLWKSKSLTSSSCKATNLILRAPPLCLNLTLITSQSLYFQIPSHWGLGHQHMNFVETQLNLKCYVLSHYFISLISSNMWQFLNIFSSKFLKGIGQSIYNIQTIPKFMCLWYFPIIRLGPVVSGKNITEVTNLAETGWFPGMLGFVSKTGIFIGKLTVWELQWAVTT